LIPVEFNGQRCSPVTGSGVEIFINDPRPLLGQAQTGPGGKVMEDEWGTMHVLPKELPSSDGYIHYEGLIMLTKRPEPLVIPVTKERYLRFLVTAWEEEIASLEATPADSMTVSLERWRREEKPRIEAENRQTLEEMKPYMNSEELAKLRQQLDESLAATEAAIRDAAAQTSDLPAEYAAGISEAKRQLQAVRSELTNLSPREKVAPACVSDWFYSSAGREPLMEFLLPELLPYCWHNSGF